MNTAASNASAATARLWKVNQAKHQGYGPTNDFVRTLFESKRVWIWGFVMAFLTTNKLVLMSGSSNSCRDSNKQATSPPKVEEQYEEPVIDLIIPERARLSEILCFQPKDLTEEQISCIRIEAVDLMVALCDKRDTGKASQTRPRPPPQHRVQQFIKEESPAFKAWSESDVFPLLMDTSQCPDCIGDERLTGPERTFQWCRPTIRNDRFDDQHLTDREDIEQRGEALVGKHPKCRNETFKHLDHFRNHVKSVHNGLLRTSEQVNRRRMRQEQRRQMVREAKAQRQQGVHGTKMHRRRKGH